MHARYYGASVLVATPAADRHDICPATGKVRHKDSAKAYGIAARGNKRHKNRVHGRTEPLHAYWRKECQGWHTGHNVKGKAA